MPSPTFGAARWARALLAVSIYGHQRPGDPRRPTCDSADILYRCHPYELPLDLAIGRRHQLPGIRLSGDGADPNSALRRPLETPNVTALTSASASGAPLITRAFAKARSIIRAKKTVLHF